MVCSTPGFPVLHYLPEFARTHVHWVEDAIQPSHPLSPSSTLNLSQHQGLFQWVGSSNQGAKVFGHSVLTSVLPMNIQGWFPLGSTSLITLLYKGCSRVFSSTTGKSINSSPISLLYGPTLASIHDYWKTIALTRQTFFSKVMSLFFNILSSCVTALLPKSKRL